MITGYFNDDDITWVTELDCELLIKPVSERDLKIAVLKALNRNRLQSELLDHEKVEYELQKLRFRERYLQKRYIERMIDEKVFSRIEADEDISLKYDDVSVGFVDIRGFTATSTTLQTKELSSYLECFYEYCSEFIKNNGGYIDKYIGDSVMWFINKTENVDYEAISVNIATDIIRNKSTLLKKIQHRLNQEVPIELKCGVVSGTAHIGLFGLNEEYAKLHFTCVGPTVNLASRLCSEAGANEIIIGGELAASYDERDGFEDIGFIEVRNHPYRVRARKLYL
jgi:adenylate cyclase